MKRIFSAFAAGAAALLTVLGFTLALSGTASAGENGGGNPWHGSAPVSITGEGANGGGNPWHDANPASSDEVTANGGGNVWHG